MTIKQLLKVFLFTNDVCKIDIDVVLGVNRGVHSFTSSAVHDLMKRNASILDNKISAVSVASDRLYIVVRK